MIAMRRRQIDRLWRHAREVEATEPAPPFLVGQRVRCAISTLDRGDPFSRVDLRGCVGTIVRMRWIEPIGDAGYWDIHVRYDLGAPHLPRHHRPEDLEAT